MGESANERASLIAAAGARRRQIEFVCEHGWAAVRSEAARLLAKGGLAPLEEAALLVSESEMRGQIPATDRQPEQIWERLRHAGHPLGWLPARRVALEQGLGVWEYRSGGNGSCPAHVPAQGEPLPTGPAVEVEVWGSAEEDALAAFESIRTHSNGKAEAIEGRLSGPAQATRECAAALAAVFAPLAPRDRYQVTVAQRVPASEAVLSLLAIAVNGGAYDTGTGVLGRLRVWRTLRSLVGGRAEDGFEEVRSRVADAAWIRFDVGDRDWFEHVAWDGCLACVEPGGVRVAAVAWTDTD